MGKIKDIFTGEHKWTFIIGTVATVFFLCSWIFGHGNTFIRWIKTEMEISRQEKQMDMYRQQIDQMDQNIEELKTNKDTLEKFAREHFHFAVPDEDVYITKE